MRRNPDGTFKKKRITKARETAEGIGWVILLGIGFGTILYLNQVAGGTFF